MEFQKNWIGLHKPKAIQIEQKSRTNTYSKFICEPLEKGYAITIGNSLRRILLSSIQGPAIKFVGFRGYSSITLPRKQKNNFFRR